MKILRDLCEDVQYLTEEKDGKKHLYIEGIALQSGVKNRNNRIYPPPVLERECGRYIKECVLNGNAFGEFGHPSGPKLNETLISHRITELRKDGNDWIGKAVVLDEGSGKLVRSIVETGGRVGVSSRGAGTLKFDKALNADVVQDDFKLIVGYDIVTNPSAPQAWANAVMENVIDWRFENGEWIAEAVDDTKKLMKTLSKSQLAERQIALFEDFLRKLAKTK